MTRNELYDSARIDRSDFRTAGLPGFLAHGGAATREHAGRTVAARPRAVQLAAAPKAVVPGTAAQNTAAQNTAAQNTAARTLPPRRRRPRTRRPKTQRPRAPAKNAAVKSETPKATGKSGDDSNPPIGIGPGDWGQWGGSSLRNNTPNGEGHPQRVERRRLRRQDRRVEEGKSQEHQVGQPARLANLRQPRRGQRPCAMSAATTAPAT